MMKLRLIILFIGCSFIVFSQVTSADYEVKFIYEKNPKADTEDFELLHISNFIIGGIKKSDKRDQRIINKHLYEFLKTDVIFKESTIIERLEEVGMMNPCKGKYTIYSIRVYMDDQSLLRLTITYVSSSTVFIRS
jgi:hypothetical protein